MKSIHTISHAPAHLAKSKFEPNRHAASGAVKSSSGEMHRLFPIKIRSFLRPRRYRSAQGNVYGDIHLWVRGASDRV
jgi:hypothetical protein